MAQGPFAQQARSNSALRTRTSHHAPVLLLWCNALVREGSWWVLGRGSLDGMQGVRGSNPLSSTRHNASAGFPLRAVCQQIVSKSLLVMIPALCVLSVSGDSGRSQRIVVSRGGRVKVLGRALAAGAWIAEAGRSTRSWPRSWGRACGGRRRPRPGRRGPRISSQPTRTRRRAGREACQRSAPWYQVR
jgi:hypothetical protein